MHNTPHLVVSVSGHGFGHVAQTAPILNALYQHIPQLRLTVRSSVPISHLRSRIHVPFDHLPSEGDIGMVMSSSIDVRVEESRTAYWDFHFDWDTRIVNEARLLRELKADLILSNVGYLPLAGARRANIPNVALCSLNWADIYQHYCGEDGISAQIHDCYANADAFLRATPGMAMTNLANLVPVAPIAAVGENRRDALNRKLHLSRDEKLVLISMGGITSRLPIETWPKIEGVRWLVQQSWQIAHPDAIILESLQMDFNDLLASSDALLCKPGYGSFVEAACYGTPVLYVSRADWPESPALITWLQQHGRCCEITPDDLKQGKIAAALKEILNAAPPEPFISTGAEQVASLLADMLANQI